MATSTTPQLAPDTAFSGLKSSGHLTSSSSGTGQPFAGLKGGQEPLPDRAAAEGKNAQSTSLATSGAGKLAPGSHEFVSEEGDGETGIPRILNGLPVGLTVAVPVREFRVHSLLAMVPGEVIETQWGHGEDLPLSSGEVQLAWTEFEVVDAKLAVRITRLA